MTNPEYSSDKIVGLVKDFINIPSVTGNREAMRNALDRAGLELEGFPHEKFVAPNSGSESVLFFNTPTRPEEFRVILNGHLDVVSGQPSQFNPYVENGKLYGRGSYDMKGGAAVELLVFRHLAKNLPYPIGLQLVTDEEIGGFDGTGYQITQGVRSKMVISGESTELNINNERKGVLVLEVTAQGKAAHAAYPHRGDNAVVKIAKFVTDISREFPITKEEKWITTLNVSGIYTSNKEHNKVPDITTAVFDIRHIPQEDKDSIRSRVKKLTPDGIVVRDGEGAGIASFSDPSQPDLVLLASCIESITRRPTKFIRKSGSSDSRHFSEIGSTSIDFGPSGEGLHSDVEYGIIESYQQYAEILASFLQKLR